MIPQDGRRIGLDLFRLWRGTWRRSEIPFVGRSMAPLMDQAKGLVISHGNSTPQPGDILVTLQRGALTAHRVVASEGPEEARRWVTQGDSCPAMDPEPTLSSQVLGRVVAVVDEAGWRSLLGPFRTLAGRWAAGQTLLLGRLFSAEDFVDGRERRAPVVRRWAFAIHRRLLGWIFLCAGSLEKLHDLLINWQVHAFRTPLWRLLSSAPGDAVPSADLLELGVREADRYCMTLLVLGRLRASDRLSAASAAESFSRREAAAALQQLRWRSSIEATLAALRRQEIPHLALKGFAQYLTLYREDAAREMRDVDLLVPPRRLEEARRALEEIGFRVAPSSGDPDFLRHHHAAPQWNPTTGLVVEIHREVVPDRVLPTGLAEGFWRRAESVEFAGGLLLVPCREDRLLQLCLHLRLHRYAGCLRDVFEVSTLVEEDTPAWDWGRVEKIAAEAGCLSTLYVGLRMAALAFGTPLPEEYLQHLARQIPPRSFREFRIRLLSRWLTGPPPERRGRGVAVLRWLCLQLAPL